MLTDQQKAFSRVLDLVEEAGCMPHVVLIGSWAEFAYREAGLLKGFDPNIRTMDVDFLIRNLRRPSPAASLASLAREKGFLVESDTLNGTTKLFDTSGLEVEFLIGKMGAGVEPALKTNVGVTAQTLRHLDSLGQFNRYPLPWTPSSRTNPRSLRSTQDGHQHPTRKQSREDARAVLGIWSFLTEERLVGVLASLTKRERAAASKL